MGNQECATSHSFTCINKSCLYMLHTSSTCLQMFGIFWGVAHLFGRGRGSQNMRMGENFKNDQKCIAASICGIECTNRMDVKCCLKRLPGCLSSVLHCKCHVLYIQSAHMQKIRSCVLGPCKFMSCTKPPRTNIICCIFSIFFSLPWFFLQNSIYSSKQVD